MDLLREHGIGLSKKLLSMSNILGQFSSYDGTYIYTYDNSVDSPILRKYNTNGDLISSYTTPSSISGASSCQVCSYSQEGYTAYTGGTDASNYHHIGIYDSSYALMCNYLTSSSIGTMAINGSYVYVGNYKTYEKHNKSNFSLISSTSLTNTDIQISKILNIKNTLYFYDETGATGIYTLINQEKLKSIDNLYDEFLLNI